MKLKTLMDQHAAFAAAQERKAAKKAARDANTTAQRKEWLLTLEAQRIRRERAERRRDLAQQRRLEDDPDYVGGF